MRAGIVCWSSAILLRESTNSKTLLKRGFVGRSPLSGQVMSITLDDDPVREPQCIVSLQLEGTGQIWHRNVYLPTEGQAGGVPAAVHSAAGSNVMDRAKWMK